MKPRHWRPAYVALGSNLHDPIAQVRRAFDLLQELKGSRLIRRSALYATAPMGIPDQPSVVNAAAGLLTELAARELFENLQGIERDMGRVKGERWGPRIIDLDLIWITGPLIDEPDLCVPHRGVSGRNFVLYPLMDIAPELLLPGLGRVRELAARVSPQGIQCLQQERTST